MWQTHGFKKEAEENTFRSNENETEVEYVSVGENYRLYCKTQINFLEIDTLVGDNKHR